MCFVTKLILSVAFAATQLSAVYSSIRFDEVEFYDPNKTLDESTSNGFVCAHLGEECQITAQCCGVATCALPSWSETPVCLVPGYKHDERFRKRFLALHNLRPADIRYIRDSYNTSQYDFLLTDLTFSAPPLDVVNTSSEVIAANVTVFNGTVDDFGDLGGNLSVDSTSAEDVVENSRIMNASVVESYETNSTMFVADENSKRGLNDSTGSVPLLSILADSAIINKNLSQVNSSNSSTNDGFDLKNHFMFLLINNTLVQSDSKLDLKEFYDQFINTDRFKNIVEQLREKMREINEKEKISGSNNTGNSTVFISYNSREIDKPTTEKTKTNQKHSKWNIVKKFFFHSKEIVNDNHNFSSKKNNDLEKIVDEIISRETLKDNSQENMNGKRVLQSDYPDNPNDNEGFKKLIEDVDKIEEIIDSDRTINTFQGSKNVNDQGTFDFYNIDVPLSSFDVTEKTEGANNSLESVFKDIGDTINSMILKNNNDGKSPQNDLVVKKYTEENNVKHNSTEYAVLNRTKAKSETSNETHFWDKIHFWRVPRNLSAEMERSLKRFFFPKESSMAEKQNKLTHLNEYFLLNLNSKNAQATPTPLKAEQFEKTSDYSSYVSSSESESSNNEELYNNSYIFMVHKENIEDPVKVSSWKKVLNLFHREKEVPLALEVNIHDIPEISSDSDNHPSKVESKNPSNVDVPEIIRLPEHLMPQALDERQGNETDWIFDDSDDLEDGIEERKSSNSSFFFFF